MEGLPGARLQLRTLGSFEVVVDGQAIADSAWPRRKTRDLLKVLATAPGTMFAVDQLIDVLLPDSDPSRGATNIRARVSELRGVLEPSLERGGASRFIRHIGEGYELALGADTWLDTLVFDHGVAEGIRRAEQEDWIGACTWLEDALALYRGPFLAEDRYADWAETPRRCWRDRSIEAMECLATCYGKLGRLQEALAYCRRILANDACRESTACLMMHLLSESDQHAQVVRTYRQLAESLREYLAVEPSDKTTALYRELSRREPIRGGHHDPRRLVVLPFVNVGDDPENMVIADGMTEELIYVLSQVSGLEVIAQTSALQYKGARKRVAEIGRELRVGSVLEGSVQRVGDRVRVLAQLVDAESEAHLWAEQYDHDLGDPLVAQVDIARRVARALTVQIQGREETAIRQSRAPSAEAHIAYVRGRFFLARRTQEAYAKASECFEEALCAAPGFARALTGLADVHCLMVGKVQASAGFAKAREYVERALELDPQCAEAHATRGYIAWTGSGNVREAEQEFLRALELNPNCTQAHEWYAQLLISTGRIEEACRQSESALSLDPLSATLIMTYANALHAARRLDEAVVQYRKALDISPELELAWFFLWYSLAGAWDWDRAEAVTRSIVAQYPENPCAYVNLSTCVMNRGRMEEGLAAIRRALELEPEPRRAYILYHAGIRFYFAREFDTAIRLLREMLDRDPSESSAHLMIAKCYMYMPGPRLEDALEEIQAAEAFYGGANPFWQVHVHMDRGKIYARRGETERAEQELATLLAGPSGMGGNRRIAIAGVLSELDRMDESMDWLDEAAAAREAHIASLRVCPDADRVRAEPRFQALLRRVGLAD